MPGAILAFIRGMLSPTAVLGWLAIGLAASLAGMIFPFRRGAAGVVLNSLVGMAGALVAVLVSYWVIDGARPDAPVRLAFAAVGAWVGLGLTHALWVSRARHAPRLS